MLSIKETSDTSARVKELVSNLRYLEDKGRNTTIEIDSIGFVTPLSITPIAASINERSLSYDYKGERSSYLETIYFPQGLRDLQKIAKSKTYIPIINLKLAEQDKLMSAQLLGQLSSEYFTLLKENIIEDPLFIKLVTENTLGLLLQEMLDNIQEHAKADNVYLFSQYWAQNDACEFCLVDDGQGLFGSLHEAGRDVKDSEDALRKILGTGLSAKTEFGDIRRGTGIKNTRALITNQELNGEFFIMSGNIAFLHSVSKGETFFRLSNYSWDGTIVMGRFNKPPATFNWTKYVK